MLKVFLRSLFVVLCLAGLSEPALAVAVDQPLDDPRQEARARAIHKQLRCLVCQNQSIEDSNAALARDLRILVRERITAGDNDEAAIRYIVERYGDWVLLQPPVKAGTALLWIGPVLFLILAIAVMVVWYRRRSSPVAGAIEPLSSEEQDRLKNLLADRDQQ
ncbi:MAG: cytochrome c-type biogenesis protein CcmH [Rhodospirillaceae bacterium]|jgi:cytochrome c-type biogenesis protein CcmH|nr:cytochrome c-type biogenesis protein CcmH [Rhodospirillaceae bacterium]MBT4489746.1 cytochrome c-type biogenesis protein CcmH [Rhodospirillaceae bacterium]MBT4687022.1 cytochrome c-type biogenesis protein CcmH [Rhodospirillaceae bacterium]MBT5898280.1 cytochrome c-type biogenesis protein CcmH [Rhodospirillaceae bacterium]MBT6430377.1 cytochrome c-type biogenesis protein CcmH [Rhodospirillaceae bacterium]